MVNEAVFGPLNCEFPPFEFIKPFSEDEGDSKLNLLLAELATSGFNEPYCRERLVTTGLTFLKYALTVSLYLDDPKLHVGRLSSALNNQVSTSC